MAFPTLLDIAKRNSADMAIGLVEEAFQAHPEVNLGAARSINGNSYETLVRKTLPTVAFRNANEGTTAGKSEYELKQISTYILNPQWQCDKAVADGSEDGAEAFIADEAAGLVEASMQHLASQFYYGVTNDAKGFPGLVAQVNSAMVVNAEGSGDDTTSVWAVCWGPRRVQWVLGNGGQLIVPETFTQRVYDGDGKPYTAYCSELLARPGLAIHDAYAIGRIKNIDAGKPLTDDLIAALIKKFPTRLRPFLSGLYMNRTAQSMLQQSRTATTTTGEPAPFPESAFGVPIYVTDAITDTETAS